MTDSISLDRLKKGFHGVSPIVGTAHAEACLICLEHHNHSTPITLSIEGTNTTQLQLQWHDTISEQAKRSWHDLTIATEWAACGIAMLLCEQILGFEVARQSKKGNGFDYWIGKKDPKTLNMQELAQLEVSGILRATNQSLISARVKRKKDQVKSNQLPTYVIVVEFSQPLAWIESK